MDQTEEINIKNKNILIISPEKWGDVFISKHHYARYLAKNNNVWFLNSPGDLSLNKKILLEKTTVENLTAINYKPIVRGINKLPSFILNQLLKKEVNFLKKEIGVNFDLVISFDPQHFWNLTLWKAHKTIYFAVDFFNNARFEKETCQSANLVLAIADLILNPLKKYNSNSFKINHGAHILSKQVDSNINIPGKNTIKAAYVGNFHNNIDYDILLKLVRNNPSVDFILIGPYQKSNLLTKNLISSNKFNDLKSSENVFFIGKISPNELQEYLSKVDVNLVLFKDEKQIIHCNPHKMMGYFYSGKIVVSNKIDEYKNSNLLLSANSVQEIPALFKKVISRLDEYNTKQEIEKRKKFAIANTYEKQINRIALLLNKIDSYD